jgi:hypothetical protein
MLGRVIAKGLINFDDAGAAVGRHRVSQRIRRRSVGQRIDADTGRA